MRVYNLVTKGFRPTRTPEIDDQRWAILQACWAPEWGKRWTFEELFQKHQEIRLPGCDNREFDDYLEFLGFYRA
jgi:hypothetical protein